MLSCACVAAIMSASSCDSEKELVIIEGNLPIKTSTLYMVGDAAPCGWDKDNPIPFEASEEDPLIFNWQGNLNRGEIKLCLTPGSWEAPFIRPLVNGEEINSNDIREAPFQMHAGNPDEKWFVSEAGTYLLTFDLRNWTMSTSFLKKADEPVIEPILAEHVYIVGDATPAHWNIDEPTELIKIDDYKFYYEGYLNTGEMKACITTGDWGVPFIRPASEGVTISTTGVSDNTFVFVANPDNKWVVETPGNYNVTFNLYDYTIEVIWLD